MSKKFENEARRPSIWLIVAALFFAGVGIAALLHPVVTGIATGLFLAVAFIITGFGSLTAVFAPDAGSSRFIYGAFGVFSLATGVLLTIYPLDGAVSFVWVIGALWAATGTLEIIQAFRNKIGRALNLLVGIVDLVIGVAILFTVPSDALEVLALLVGFGLILRAVWMGAAGYLFRRLGA